MLEQAETMFDDMARMLDRIKRKVYKERMEYFRKKNAQLLTRMVCFVEEAEEQEEVENQDQTENQEEAENQSGVENQDQVKTRHQAAAEVAKTLADAVETRFAKRGKISGRNQMDINLFMIYYVFPAILLTKSECAGLLADAVRDEWRVRFRDSEKLDYTTYESLCETFKEVPFGLPQVYGRQPKV